MASRYRLSVVAIALRLAAWPSVSLGQMTTFEEQVLAEMNLARTDPAGYALHIERLLQYFDGNLLRLPGETALQTNEGPRAVREAAAALRATPRLPALAPSRGLARAARDHALDQGPRGGLGHTGSDGSSMGDRIGGQHTPRSIRENMLACVDKFGPPQKLPTVCTCVEDAATLCRKYGYWVTCAWQEDKNDHIAPDLRHDWWTVGMCLERYKQ